MAGSFGPPKQAIEKQIKDARVSAPTPPPTVPPAADTAAPAGEDPKSRLPKEIQSEVHGTIAYAEFKKKYNAIWEQVAQKDNLLTGRVLLDTTIFKTPVKLRHWTKREQIALTGFMPEPADRITPGQLAEQQMTYAMLRLVVQVVRIGDMVFPSDPLSTETRDVWRKSQKVQQAYDYLLDLDPMVITHLFAQLGDMETARYLALMENIENP